MTLTKAAVTRIIVVFHIVTIGAVVARIDTFPLTWVPMYSQFHGHTDLVVPVGDRTRTRAGFAVTTASGTTERINRADLNIPSNAFRRIFHERAFGKGPPKHLRERANLNPVSDAVFDLWYPDPATSIDWGPRLLDMLNASLGRAPGEANYIVRAVAESDFAVLPRAQRRAGDFDDLNLERRFGVVEYPAGTVR